MAARRRRILHAARVMIAELGYENFSFRELAERASVAQRTLYNVFGSRENIISSAIYAYLKAFTDRAAYAEPADTLQGQLERLIKVQSRNLQIRAYATAIMAVYNTQKANPSIRLSIRQLIYETIRPFVDRIAKNGEFATHATPDAYAEHVASFTYCTLSSWAVGEIADEVMVESMAETLLMVTLTFTRGAARVEAEAWLDAVRGRTQAWLRLREASRAPQVAESTP
jgi:AcrR family transcriptional regulator